jgi:hypothetical protein
MFLCYIDEADDRVNYYITALVINSKDVRALHEALDSVMEYAEVNYKVPKSIELHGYSLVQAEHDWKILKGNIAAQKDIYAKAMNEISNLDLRIYIRGVPINHYQKRYGTNTIDIHLTALLWNLERVQDYVESQDTEVLVIADELRGGQEALREAIRFYRENPTYGYKGRILDRVVDSLHFAPSKDSRLLQATDLVSYAHHRFKRDFSHPELTKFHYDLWNILVSNARVYEASVWQPF